MIYEYVAVGAPPKVRVTWATLWDRLQGLIDFIKNYKNMKKHFCGATHTTDDRVVKNTLLQYLLRSAVIFRFLFFSIHH